MQSISCVFAPDKGVSFRAREYAGVTIVNNAINLEAGKKEKKKQHVTKAVGVDKAANLKQQES